MKLQIMEKDRAEAKKIVNKFKKDKTKNQIFYNLCFAILAPQTTFKSNKKVISILEQKNYFNRNISKEELEDIVKPTRFFRNKAKFLSMAKNNFDNILDLLKLPISAKEKRKLLVNSVSGIGMKAASHFLRNLGYAELAIIDTHVLKFLGKKLPRNNNEYLSIENELTNLSESRELSVAELDVIIWKRCSKTDWEDFDY